MSAVQHTPGPWAITQRHNALKDEIGVRGQAVCTVWTRQPPPIREQGTESIAWPEGEANASLIAAAPELVEALKGMLDAMDDGSDEPTLVAARAAVAKATWGTA